MGTAYPLKSCRWKAATLSKAPENNRDDKWYRAHVNKWTLQEHVEAK